MGITENYGKRRMKMDTNVSEVSGSEVKPVEVVVPTPVAEVNSTPTSTEVVKAKRVYTSRKTEFQGKSLVELDSMISDTAKAISLEKDVKVKNQLVYKRIRLYKARASLLGTSSASVRKISKVEKLISSLKNKLAKAETTLTELKAKTSEVPATPTV